MIFDGMGLIVAYVVLAGLLLMMLLYSPWHWFYKAGMIVAVSAFFYVSYFSITDYLGWPTAKHRPNKLQIVAIYIDAPNKIYLWGHDLDRGLANKKPRAYELKYSKQLNNSLNRASNKIKKGFPMVGEFRPPSTKPRRVDDIEVIDQTDDFELVLYDLPEALIPPPGK